MRKPVLWILMFVIASAGAVRAQKKPAHAGRVPSAFDRHVGAIGNRLRVPGKERTVYLGEVTDGGGKKSRAVVVHQPPGLVRLEGFKQGQGILAFDGERAQGPLSRQDDLVLEAFVSDTPEGLFASLEDGAAVRLLGTGFGPDPRKAPNYTGPRYDIYDVAAPVQSRAGGFVRSKLYYFESSTGLLQSTRYYDRTVSPAERVETRFSDWQIVDGAAYARRMDHLQGGRVVFSFVAATITPAPRIEPEGFR